METKTPRKKTTGASGFLNFLRGMETKTPRKKTTGASGFLNFLRGMETRGTDGHR